METIPEVIAFLDEHERDLDRMKAKVKEYRYMLFAHLQAQGLDSDDESLLD